MAETLLVPLSFRARAARERRKRMALAAQKRDEERARELEEARTADLANGVVDAIAKPFMPYGEWLAKNVSHMSFTARHFVAMQEKLDELTQGVRDNPKSLRKYFQIPIRHGKSTHNTEWYCAYRLWLDPRTRILLVSYNQKQTDLFSVNIRTNAIAVGVVISPDKNAANEWKTMYGGGVRSVGIGGKTASINADLIVIDDPIGSREDGESELVRSSVWDALTNDVFARAHPHTGISFTMSRWHMDDPAGRLQDKQKDLWDVLDLPGEGIVERDAHGNELSRDMFNRADGEPLWPEFLDAAYLAQKKIELTEYGFASLVQGRPRPREGGMFKWAWWQFVEDMPKTGRMIRYWDLAGTVPKKKGHDPDFTAGVLGARMIDHRTVVCDVVHFRKSVAERDATIKEVCADDLKKYRGRVAWWIEAEAGIDGDRRTEDLVRDIQALGMAVFTEHPTGNKVYRAEPVASAAQVGNILLLRDADRPAAERWNDGFRMEHADFPFGKHDDRVDATGGMYSKLGQKPPGGTYGTAKHGQ